MSKHKRKDSRTTAAVKVALVAITIGGGLAMGFAKNSPDAVAAQVAGPVSYVTVGHVPADLVARLLEEKPEVAGIAVPGMPIGSPGMEGFGRTDHYDVIAFGPDGVEYVFESR